MGDSDFVDSTSKLGLFVRINSIAIDISSAMEASEPPKHEHFSIRGFVADMRKKDLKTCYPFAPQGNDADPVNYQLPPLSVPEFRWWQCSSCVPNAETKTTTKEMVVATTHRRDNTDAEGEGIDQSKINKTLSLRSSDFTCSKGKADIRDIEARNSRHMPEVNRQQVFKRLNNTPVEEPDNVSYGRDGPLSALANRRKPKLRSLADILVEERTQTRSFRRTGSASSSGMKVASTEMESVLVPQHQVDVPAGLAEAERKRKISLREDTEPLLSIFPSAFAKRNKGLVLDPKKVKAIDANKKMRHTRRDNETAQMGESLHPNNISSASLQEQTQKIGAVDGPLLHPRRSIFGNSNGGGTMDLGLSLNSFKDPVGDHNDQSSSRKRRYIPDLNVEISEKADMEEEQQFTTLSKERSFPLQKTANASAFHSYKTGKRITDPRNKDNNAELGASDDIPIEIVELLAKNLHERERGRDTTERYPSAAAFPLPSSINVSNGNMGVQPNKYPMDMRKLSKPECSSIMAGAKSTTWEEMLDSRAQKRPILPSPVSFLDKWRSADAKGKKVVTDVAEVREEGRGIGSSDPYQSDTIPAMQLLSLMDQRVKISDPSYKVGEPLSPCKHHPRLNGKENLSFLHFPENGSSSSLRVTQDQARSSKSNEEELGECTLNRNPADFSIPRVGNEFTITARDLKRGKKTNGLKGKSRVGNADGRKRGRKPRRKRV